MVDHGSHWGHRRKPSVHLARLPGHLRENRVERALLGHLVDAVAVIVLDRARMVMFVPDTAPRYAWLAEEWTTPPARESVVGDDVSPPVDHRGVRVVRVRVGEVHVEGERAV